VDTKVRERLSKFAPVRVIGAFLATVLATAATGFEPPGGSHTAYEVAARQDDWYVPAKK
jgi:hypothetical protein